MFVLRTARPFPEKAILRAIWALALNSPYSKEVQILFSVEGAQTQDGESRVLSNPPFSRQPTLWIGTRPRGERGLFGEDPNREPG